jgi:hypothetical protein
VAPDEFPFGFVGIRCSKAEQREIAGMRRAQARHCRSFFKHRSIVFHTPE